MTKEEKIIRKKQERKEFKAYIDLSDNRVLNTKKAALCRFQMQNTIGFLIMDGL